MNKKILMLLSNAFQPDPRPYYEALSLVRAGYAVKILCWDRGEALPPKENIDGIDVERISLRSRHGRGLAQAFFLFILWARLLSRVLKDSSGIVYCHDLDTLPPGLAAKLFARKAVVLDNHDIFSKVIYNLPGPVVNMAVFLERVLVKRADAVITASDRTRRYYESFGAKDITVVPNWKRAEDFHFEKEKIALEKKRLGIKENQIVVSYISNLGPERMIEPLIKAVASDLNLFLIAGGEGPKRKLLEDASRLHPNIAYLGFVPYAQACLYTALCDVVYYGYSKKAAMAEYCNPNKLFEALAAGKAFLGSALGETAEIVSRENCGIALEDITDDSLKEAFADLKDRNRLRQFQENAGKAALIRYNWPNAEKNLLGLFAQLTARQ